MVDRFRRIPVFDLVRGCALICMIIYHGIYDWALFSHRLSFVYQSWMVVIEAGIAWTFIFLSSWMARFSHNNVRRGFWYLFWALIVFAATLAADIDIPITYGILFCLGASTFIIGVLQKVRPLPSRLLWSVVSFLLFLLLYSVPQHRLGIGPFSLPLPSFSSMVYGHGLAFLGFPGADFQSGDYFPLVPFFFLYLSGAIASNSVPETIYSKGPFRWSLPVLNWMGRHSLLIYLIHQPILMGIIWIIFQLNMP